MREIKFRAYFHKYKMMDYNPYGDEFITEGTPVNELFTGFPFGDGTATIMQYTELKDKNGKEVYEGDIVKTLEHANYMIRWYNLDEGGVSTYGYYMEAAGMPDVVVSLNPTQSKRIEVIGNVYENPELLSKGH